MFDELSSRGLRDLGRMLRQRSISAEELVEHTLRRIDMLDRAGPKLRSVIEVNPDAVEHAQALDAAFANGDLRGPLHGIPILIKDNIETADSTQTTAGSLALLGAQRRRDAPVAAKLRAAGAVLVGKANLSEWANFRSSQSSSGWSARGGQTRNPYVLDRSPIGSSSGSAAAVAAALVAGSLGSETSGSIVCPAAACGVVGVKPTVGICSRSGIVPISHVQDTAGPFARTVEDAALLLSLIQGEDPSDPATLQFRRPQIPAELDRDALNGARIGVPRVPFFGTDERADRVIEAALDQLRSAGAEIVDPVAIPSIETLTAEEGLMFDLLLHEFKSDINRYLQGLDGFSGPRTLDALIEFNREHAAQEMPYFGQELFEMAQERPGTEDPTYVEKRARATRLSRVEGIDAVLGTYRLDAMVAPTTGVPWPIDLEHGDPHSGGSCAWLPALAGYPAVSVPAGQVDGLPIGMTFFGTGGSDATLLGLAHAYEQRAGGYCPPEFRATLT